MQRFDVLRDGPFRYIHCTQTGALLTTLVQVNGKFVEEGEEAPARTMREWKAILARKWH
jgi:hypothetical protein